MREVTDDAAAVRECCTTGALLLWQELRDVYGHVSCRMPSGDGFYLGMVRVQPSGQIYPALAFDSEGRALDEIQGPSEIFLHTEIYRARPEVMAIAHAHPHTATALSATRQSIYAVNMQSRQFGDGLPTFRGDLVHSTEMAAELAATMGDEVAILLRGHGAVTVGAHVPEAVTHMLALEQAAQQILWAKPFGGADPLPAHLRKIPSKRTAGLLGETYQWRQLMWEKRLRSEGGAPGSF